MSEISSDEDRTGGLKCKHCEKVCKSKRGLSRHTNAKHSHQNGAPCNTSVSPDFLVVSAVDEVSLKKLHPLQLKVFVKHCAEKLTADLCYPEQTRKLFSTDNFSFSTDEAHKLWCKLRPVIDVFNGDAEKFYSECYALFVDNLLPGKLETRFTNSLLAEVANLVLMHLFGSKFESSGESAKAFSIPEKEMKSLQYLAGYILHKLHSKFRFTKKYYDISFNKECVMILRTYKVEEDNTQILVNVRDRGGLWMANKRIQEVFLQCKLLFRTKTVNFTTSLDCKDLVNDIMKNSSVLSNLNCICYGIDPKVTKEISLNLLEDMLSLFVKVNTFSYAKDIREKHKAAKKMQENIH